MRGYFVRWIDILGRGLTGWESGDTLFDYESNFQQNQTFTRK